MLTGSANWSWYGDKYNDENMIVIQSAEVANLYFQEWLARYTEAGGEYFDSAIESREEDGSRGSLELSSTIVTDFLKISFYPDGMIDRSLKVEVVDLFGRRVDSIDLVDEFNGDIYTALWHPDSYIGSGLYFISISGTAFSRRVLVFSGTF